MVEVEARKGEPKFNGHITTLHFRRITVLRHSYSYSYSSATALSPYARHHVAGCTEHRTRSLSSSSSSRMEWDGMGMERRAGVGLSGMTSWLGRSGQAGEFAPWDWLSGW